ncbi:MAG: thioredoxin family protein, partial [Bacteroidales bacterium]|nr:thioredoxin family protein [Bacteroidales bacterium]
MKTIQKIAGLLLISLFTIGTLAAQGYKVGDAATDFKLKGVDNKMVSLADHKDAKGFIVIFT